jgi:poly-gamma-glutamate synthesis protein (capsule biosynthesis protein)
MMHGKQIENTSREGSGYDFSSFFSLIEDEISNADLAIGNMEFTLGGKPYTGYPNFSAPDGFESYLAECGFDVFLAANNHIYDKGAAGADRTLEKYRVLRESHGIQFTGLAGNEEELEQTTPLMLMVNGVRIALINFTYGTNHACGKHWPRTNYLNSIQKLEEAFAKAEEQKADFVIALPHWGSEYILRHNSGQEKMARMMIEKGADAIIGSHPHVIQDRQEIDGVTVAYSLGNAVSNMSATNTQLELMATLKIVRYSNGDLEMLQPSFKYLWCSLPGGYNNSYTVIPVEDFLDRRDQWHGKWDYDKMVDTYNRIKK